jgi:hypothetical protein
MAAQLAEQLFQVGQRDLLALADGGQRHRPRVRAQRQVDHRRDGKSALGGQTHEILLCALRRRGSWTAARPVERPVLSRN